MSRRPPSPAAQVGSVALDLEAEALTTGASRATVSTGAPVSGNGGTGNTGGNSWHQLRGLIDPSILTAPGLNWDEVDPRTIALLRKTLAKHPLAPWGNTLALVAVVSTCIARLDAYTVYNRVLTLNARWRALFPAFGLTRFADWRPIEHLPRYLRDTALPDSDGTRLHFIETYEWTSGTLQRYLEELSPIERDHYAQWAGPGLPHAVYARLNALHGRTLRAATEQRRKMATDAILPQFPAIRAEAHRRWNQLDRLRAHYTALIAQVEAGTVMLPAAFSYDEQSCGATLHFVLWNRQTFVLAHASAYSRRTLDDLRSHNGTFSPAREHYFLELVGAEPLRTRGAGEIDRIDRPDRIDRRDSDASSLAADHPMPAGLWFGELLREQVLGNNPRLGPVDVVARRQAFLRSWGYGSTAVDAADAADAADATEDAEGDEASCHAPQGTALVVPFRADNPGLLTWPKEQVGKFLIEAQARTGRTLFLVEPLFAAATLGLAGLELLTTTGARLHEVLQVSLSPACLHTLTVNGQVRLILRLDPKGALDGHADEAHPVAEYYASEEIKRTFSKVRALLAQYYGLGADDPLPTVPYARQSHAHHHFGARPYLFQYSGCHLTQQALTACIRFLCHGLAFRARDGRLLVVGAHLLRHAFASHLHQVEKVPLDIIAVLLHHKDLRVSRYYAAPTPTMVMQQHFAVLDGFTTDLGDFDNFVLRAPSELRQQLEDARAQFGPLNHVLGGTCSCPGLCPISFACVPCTYLIPDPQYRADILERQQAAAYWLQRAQVLGLAPEVAKMRQLIQECAMVLAEMDQIEAYRADEATIPPLHIEPRTASPSSATGALG